MSEIPSHIKKLDLAIQILTTVWQDTQSPKIVDVLEMLYEYRRHNDPQNAKFTTRETP